MIGSKKRGNILEVNHDDLRGTGFALQILMGYKRGTKPAEDLCANVFIYFFLTQRSAS